MNELNSDNKQQAFVLRIALSGFGVEEALQANQIAIGWSDARGLLTQNLPWNEFRQIISDRYYPEENNMRKAGLAAGNMCRFIREMNQGDLVVVPHDSNFYVAKVTDRATYDEANIDSDSAHRRYVEWLNNGAEIPRRHARAALIARMNIRNTSAYATDLLPQIEEVLEIAKKGAQPTFWTDLQNRLIRETLDEIRSGRMDDYKFEELARDLLTNFGAKDARIVARNKDQGADIVTSFNMARVIDQTVAVQVKYHRHPEPPVGKDVVDQLIKGINSEAASLGIIVTASTVSDEARAHANNFFEESGIMIEMVDGELLAKLIVEYGVNK